MNRPTAVLGRLAGKVTGRVVETVQPDLILSHIDVDALMDRIDVNRVLDRVDLDRLLDRIEIDRLVDRVDLERLLERVDLDALAERIDVERLVRRSGLPGIVVESQARLAGSVLDVVRRQLAGLDAVMDMLVVRLLRRGPQPIAPRLLADPEQAWNDA